MSAPMLVVARDTLFPLRVKVGVAIVAEYSVIVFSAVLVRPLLVMVHFRVSSVSLVGSEDTVISPFVELTEA